MSEHTSDNAVDEYIAGLPPQAQKAVSEIRALIRRTAPDATETISYSAPTFDLDGRHLVHFAGWPRHIGFYPTPSGIEAFIDELEPYKHARGSVQFPLDQPMPMDLIRRIVEFRVGEIRGEAAK